MTSEQTTAHTLAVASLHVVARRVSEARMHLNDQCGRGGSIGAIGIAIESMRPITAAAQDLLSSALICQANRLSDILKLAASETSEGKTVEAGNRLEFAADYCQSIYGLLEQMREQPSETELLK